MILYVYKGSVCHDGVLYMPGKRIDVTGIAEANVKAMRKAGILISATEKKALERASELARDGSEPWVVGVGKEGYMPEPQLTNPPAHAVRAAIERIRSERGEEPERVVADSLPEPEAELEFEDEPEAEAEFEDEAEDEFEDEE